MTRLVRFKASHPSQNPVFNFDIYINPSQVTAVREVVDQVSIVLSNSIEYMVKESIEEVLSEFD